MKPLLLILIFLAVFLAVTIPSLLTIAKANREKSPEKQIETEKPKAPEKKKKELGKLVWMFLFIIVLAGIWYFRLPIAEYLKTNTANTDKNAKQSVKKEKQQKWVLHWTRPEALKGLVKEPEMYLETKILRWDNDELKFTTYFLAGGGKAADIKLKRQADSSYLGSWRDIYGQKGTIRLSQVSSTRLTGWIKNKGRNIKIPTELQLR